MKMLNTKTKRWALGLVLSAAFLTASYIGARHYAWPAIKARRIAGMNEDAAAFFAKGDLANAVLMARKSLQASMANPEAWRIAAKASKARDSGEAVGYQDYLCQIEPTKENQLEMIRLALHFNALAPAAKAVAAVAHEARDDAEFHDLALQLNRRMGRAPEIRTHLVALARLRPTDDRAQLDLAEIELAEDKVRKNEAVRQRIAKLAAQPEFRARALAMLLRDSVAARRTEEARALSHQLQATPTLERRDRLALIEGLLFAEEPTAGTELARLQSESTERADDAALVIELLMRTGQAGKGYAWFKQLPEATRKQEPAQHAAAEALLALGEWRALGVHLRTAAWTDREFLRQALLARVARAEGRNVEFAEAWRLALIAGGADVRKALGLLKRAEDWNWKSEIYDVVWKLFALMPEHEPVRSALVTWERGHGNTVNLHKIFTRVVELNPADATARNNLAYTSLLLDTNLAQAGLMAAALAEGDPKNPFFATTHALALYKQGKAPAALARMDALRASDRVTPERMLLRGLFTAFAGDAGAALDLIDGVVLKDLLPEEKSLVETARTEIARRLKTQGNSTRLIALRSSGSTASNGWLASMSVETRAAATTEMQLADSLYASGDWSGLHQLLRADSWQKDEYLRFALVAYESRRRGDLAAGQQAWRQAVASADRAGPRVQNLRRLTSDWQWAPERLETLNLLFERDPSDQELLAALLKHYREEKRTAELVRVLNLHAAQSSVVSDSSVALAYYSLLRGLGAARAHVTARNAHEAQPTNVSYRFVYAFSLLKQRRAEEAAGLLRGQEQAATAAWVPAALLRAAILTETGALEEARRQLAAFESAAALPEEVTLATQLGRRVAAAD